MPLLYSPLQRSDPETHSSKTDRCMTLALALQEQFTTRESFPFFFLLPTSATLHSQVCGWYSAGEVESPQLQATASVFWGTHSAQITVPCALVRIRTPCFRPW